MISHRQCMRPRESVEPMYMPGRLRTASSPSSTERWRAVYWAAVAVDLGGTPPIIRTYGPAAGTRPARCGQSVLDAASGNTGYTRVTVVISRHRPGPLGANGRGAGGS